MRILVTGGAGYIGSHTCVELLAAGHEIVVVDNLCNSHMEAVERVRAISGKDFPFYQIDVRDEAALEAVFVRHPFDCVIHFAGLKAVGESVEKPLEYYDNNLNCTLTLARVMEKTGVSRIVFSSSATVYAGENEMPLTEDAALGCINPYGWTKFMGEKILEGLAEAHKDWSVVLLRYFNPLGAHESGRIGEDPNGIPNNLLPFITQTAIGRHPYLSVYGADYPTPDGTGVRDYIHVIDLARGHLAAIRYAEHHPGVEIVNLGTGVGYSVMEIVRTFERVSGVNIPYRVAPRRAGDLPVCYANPSKAERVLGWRAEKTIEDMCRDSWRWQRMNPSGYQEAAHE